MLTLSVFKSYKQIVSLVIVIGFIATGMAFAPNPTHAPGATGHSSGSPPPYSTVAQVYIKNNLSVATPAYFDERLVVNSSLYSAYENANLSNIFFTNFYGAIVPSWLESGNSYTYNNTTYWLKIAQSIPAHSLLVIYMDAASPVSTNVLNNYSTGEAPQLSAVYGQYDDGWNIFNLYDNFSGTSLNSKMWNSGGSGSFAVHNGITFKSADAYITSKTQYKAPGYVEAYGIMNSPNTNNSTSYDLGGVGFGNGGLDFVAPVMTTGWAENHTNAIGLTVYNNTGPYEFNVSNSVNPLVHHVFGTGFINTSLVSTTIDNVIENYSTIPLLIPITQKLNVTLGFQAKDFPTINNFNWIFEINSTSNGLNLPSTLQGYTVSIVESGLPPSTFWTLNIANVTGIANGGLSIGNQSYTLPDGTYNYTIASTDNQYRPVNASSSFTVNGGAITVYMTFTLVTYNETFAEYGLPAGANWSVAVDNISYYSITPFVTIPLGNGTYTAYINGADGYQAYPDMGSFSINGAGNILRIAFQSPANQSYLRGTSTIYPLEQKTYSGYALIPSPYNGLTSIALDQKDNLLFLTSFFSHNVTVMNLTTGVYLGNITLPYAGSPVTSYFDPNNGYLYVGDANNGLIDIINPVNESLISTFAVNQLFETLFTIVPGTQPNLLYAFGYDGLNENNGTIYTFNLTGSVLSEVNFTNMHAPFSVGLFGPLAYAPPVYDNTLLVGNISGVVGINVSTGSEQYIRAPFGESPGDMVPFGEAGNYIVGNLNGSSNLTFNLSTMSYHHGPDVNGMVFSGMLDTVSGIDYLSTYGKYNGNITAVSPLNDTVLGSAPVSFPTFNMVFDSHGQSLYYLDYPFTTNAVHVFSLLKAYPVTFSENGLTKGTWYVNITGLASSGPIAAGSPYTVVLISGESYFYTIGTDNKLFSSVPGSFVVGGGPSTATVQFNPVEYKLSIKETGLGANVTWTVTINNVNHTVSGTVFTIAVQNGTYHYSISTVNGYSITNQTGNITVSGSAVNVSVKFSSNSSNSSTPVTLYAILGGAIGIVLVGSGFMYFRRRQKNKGETPKK